MSNKAIKCGVDFGSFGLKFSWLGEFGGGLLWLVLGKGKDMSSNNQIARLHRWIIRTLLVLTAFSALGMITKFVPSNSYAFCAQIVVGVAVVIFSLFIYYQLHKANVNNKKRNSKEYKSLNLPEIVSPPLVAFFLFYFSLIYGFPSLIHIVIANDKGRAEFIAYKPTVSYSSTSGRCKGAIKVDTPLLFTQRICNVNQKAYESLNDGDTLVVYGRQSIFGIGL